MAPLTVLMSVFDEKTDFLSIAIDSILNQTFSNFTFLIINDGSTRLDTINCLKSFLYKDKRIRIINQENIGLTKSLNIGIKSADSKYIARQDSDDWSSPQRLEKQLELFEQSDKIGLVGSYIFLHQENGRPLWLNKFPVTSKEILASFPSMNPFCHGAVCFRKNTAESIGLYREALQCGQDYDFLWRICETCDCANIDEALYHYRFTKNSISAQKIREQAHTRQITRVLAAQRAEKPKKENIEIAWNQTNDVIKKQFPDPAESYLSTGDRLLLAGAYFSAFLTYSKAAKTPKRCVISFLKICRLILFIFIPPIRKHLFNIYQSH